MSDCALCRVDGEQVLWSDRRCRVILVANADYPAFCRVVWNRHVREMTDLTKSQRVYLLNTVYAVEQALRQLIRPDKINLASLGNQVPHLHWHVIPRFADDAHFPDPVWATKKRPGSPHAVDAGLLERALRDHLGGRQRRPR